MAKMLLRALGPVLTERRIWRKAERGVTGCGSLRSQLVRSNESGAPRKGSLLWLL